MFMFCMVELLFFSREDTKSLQLKLFLWYD